jgi:two-component system, OmpR family, sensor kinase
MDRRDAQNSLMSARPLTGVRARMLASYVVLLAIALVASVVVVRQVLLVRLDDRIQEDLTQEVQEFEKLAGGVDPETGQPFGGDVKRIFDVYLSRNTPGEGEELITVPRDGIPRYLSSERAEPAADSLLNPATVRRWRTLQEVERAEVETPIGEARYVAVPVKARGRTRGTFVVANFPTDERAEVDEAVRIVAIVAGAVLLIGTLIAFAITGRVLAPLRELRDTADSIGASDLSRRIELDGNDELTELAATFNRMLDRLQDAFASQREFIRDASHELRTPIAIVRGHLELLAEYEQTPDERAETLALVTDELDRMGRFVEELLLLAKAERSDFLRLETVDVAELTEDVLSKAQGLGERQWVRDGNGRGLIVADPQRLTQAMLNLAHNAVQHTDPGDEIAIGSTVGPERARLWVADTGPGVAPEDRRRIFSRLARGRGDRTHHDGAGLGLAIVEAIAEAHGGAVELDSRPGEGARFEIVVPTDAELRGGAP